MAAHDHRKSPTEHDSLTVLATEGRFAPAQPIEKGTWLNDSGYFAWFRMGHQHASTKPHARVALSKCSPEELYFGMMEVMRGAHLAGFSPPDRQYLCGSEHVITLHAEHPVWGYDPLENFDGCGVLQSLMRSVPGSTIVMDVPPKYDHVRLGQLIVRFWNAGAQNIRRAVVNA